MQVKDIISPSVITDFIIKHYKSKKFVLALLTLLGVVVPIGLYALNFGVGLWAEHDKWAEMGSFFGGVLSPIFTFMTAVLLLLTLNETKKSNKEQLEMIRNQQFNDHFYTTIGYVNTSLNSSKFGSPFSIYDRSMSNFFVSASHYVASEFKFNLSDGGDTHSDAWENARAYIRKNQGILDAEVTLLWPLLIKIKELDSSRQQEYLTSLKGMISNDHRFWLEAYAGVWSLEFRFALEGLGEFSKFPKPIENKVQEIEDSFVTSDFS